MVQYRTRPAGNSHPHTKNINGNTRVMVFCCWVAPPGVAFVTRLGKTDEAVTADERAQRLAEEQGDTALVDTIKQELESYRKSSPAPE